jgi:large subunit ribosomal protein L15e
MVSGYKRVQQVFEQHDNSYQSPNWYRLIALRRSTSVHRVPKPTNIPRARALGYKAKQGIVVVSSKVRRGTMRKLRPRMGRKPRNMGVNKITPKKSLQRIAEERAARHYPNMEVLNSYKLTADNRAHYFEVILVDRSHPVIRSDPNFRWLQSRANFRRVYRGLTSAGKRGRGLHNRGRGTERIRPSLRANRHRWK